METKLIVLQNNLMLLTQIEEVGADIGEPDCKLIKPFVLHKDETLSAWLIDVTSETTFMISSEKILTLTNPKPTLLEKYQSIIK